MEYLGGSKDSFAFPIILLQKMIRLSKNIVISDEEKSTVMGHRLSAQTLGDSPVYEGKFTLSSLFYFSFILFKFLLQ